MEKQSTKLSIVIPVYNETVHLPQVLKKLDEVDLPWEKEVIIIDDCSNDGTREYIETLSKDEYTIILKEKNEGKGSALREGFKHVTGDFVIIQDADLEYDIDDYEHLIAPLVAGESDVVYGSRFLDMERFNSPYPLHIINNKMITGVSNVFTGLRLTDMETCYKVFRRDVLESFYSKLTSNRFGIEPEMTHYIARGGWKIKEIPVSYNARTFEEGKKIRMRDGFAAVWHIVNFHLRK